jgi:pilus assembly protein CpaB
MRAKTMLTVLFLISIGVAGLVLLHAMSQKGDATEATKDQILVATMPLPAGTLLRAQDVAWHSAAGPAGADQFVRPAAAALAAKPELSDESRAEVYGAVLRDPVAAGDPIRRSGIVKPGDRDFLQVVLSPGARAVAIPVATGGASTGLLSPGDRVDVILTQNFRGENAPLTRRSVSETVVEDLRVLAIDAPDAKNTAAGSTFGRTVTLDVTSAQAEKINVATELGKLSLILRSASGRDGLASTASASLSRMGNVKPTWAGDVSPALSGATPPEKSVAVQPPAVAIIHGSRGEAVKPD